jgi:hypothetical protein
VREQAQQFRVLAFELIDRLIKRKRRSGLKFPHQFLDRFLLAGIQFGDPIGKLFKIFYQSSIPSS